MPRKALNPFEAASALLVEAKGVRRAAEQQAWQQYETFKMQEGAEHISTRYWLTVAGAIAERTETPSVEDQAPKKTFDVRGNVTVH